LRRAKKVRDKNIRALCRQLQRRLHRARVIMPVTFALLQRQDATTSEAVIAQLRDYPPFEALAAAEARETAARDRADDEKLQAGVDLAVAKGVLPAGLVPAPYHSIPVEG
jgi:hypothetical protein